MYAIKFYGREKKNSFASFVAKTNCNVFFKTYALELLLNVAKWSHLANLYYINRRSFKEFTIFAQHSVFSKQIERILWAGYFYAFMHLHLCSRRTSCTFLIHFKASAITIATINSLWWGKNRIKQMNPFVDAATLLATPTSVTKTMPAKAQITFTLDLFKKQ